MGALNGPYTADFPQGSRVRIADRSTLEKFRSTWKLHNPLRSEQLEFAGQSSIVKSVGYYHVATSCMNLQTYLESGMACVSSPTSNSTLQPTPTAPRVFRVRYDSACGWHS